MRKSTNLVRLIVVVLLLVAMAVPCVKAAPLQMPSAARSSRMWLTLRLNPNWSYEHWFCLEGSGSFNGSSYIIVNMRTYQAYRWSFWGNFAGRARFGISTAWALQHLRELSGPWLLLYNY